MAVYTYATYDESLSGWDSNNENKFEQKILCRGQGQNAKKIKTK